MMKSPGTYASGDRGKTETKPKISGDRAASEMMQKRGYVVIGVPASETAQVAHGQVIEEFAGALLAGELIVEKRTNRKDWDEQVIAIFGTPAADKNEHVKGERLFRCRYEAPQ